MGYVQRMKRADAEKRLAGLLAQRGATLPRKGLLGLARAASGPAAVGPPSAKVLDELREERI